MSGTIHLPYVRTSLAAVVAILALGLFGIELSAASSVSSGDRHTCAAINSELSCWGDGSDGKLGNGANEISNTPVNVVGLSAGVTSVATGDNHTCAIVNSGVKCWGLGTQGRLGTGSNASSNVPVDVVGLSSNVTAISAGSSHTCAVQGGAAKCWGFGELGVPGTVSSSVPLVVSGLASGVSEISAGSGHTCAIADAVAKCWGDGIYGQLGGGNSNSYSLPVEVVGLEGEVTGISAGGAHTCAIVSGSAKCWGWDYYGQLGNDSSGSSYFPVGVEGMSGNVTAISAGGGHTCAVMTGAVKCWGSGDHGQLGNGTYGGGNISTVPVNASGLGEGTVEVSAGSIHTCAMQFGLKCWGNGTSGQLGRGTSGTSPTPVIVAFNPPNPSDPPPELERWGDENSECREVEVIGVRGSRGSYQDVSPNIDPSAVADRQVMSFISQLARRVRYADTALTSPTGKEIGDVQWIQYDAAVAFDGAATSEVTHAVAQAWANTVGLLLYDESPQPINIVANSLVAAAAKRYADSVNQGVERLKEKLAARSSYCEIQNKPVKFVLAGYSQGAQIIGKAIDEGLDVSHVAGVALMGDPTFSVKNSGNAIWYPGVTGGENFVPRGSIRERTTPFRLTPPVFSGCRSRDLVCEGLSFFMNMDDHSKYDQCTVFEPQGEARVLLPPLAVQLADRIATGPLALPLTKNGGKPSCGVDGQWSRTIGGSRTIGNIRSNFFGDTGNSPAALLPASAVNVRPGMSVNLSAAASLDPNGEPLEFAWDLDGDGIDDISKSEPSLMRSYAVSPAGPVRLTATNSSGDSATSQLIVDVSESAVGEPGAPWGVEVTPRPGGVSVDWIAPADDGGKPLTEFKITDALNGRPVATVSADQTTVVLENLKPNTAVSLKVRASNGTWEGEDSQASQTVFVEESPTFTHPPEPSELNPEPLRVSIGNAKLSVGKNSLHAIVSNSSPGVVKISVRARLRGRLQTIGKLTRLLNQTGTHRLKIKLNRAAIAALRSGKRLRATSVAQLTTSSGAISRDQKVILLERKKR